ncbi:MAG: ssb1 [Frondihabitans sp.]|nr:ssb1 [Frondihabitans sp.]
MNTQDTITLTGVVATTPRRLTTNEGLNIASFRFASTSRRFDQPTQKWVDSTTNWFTVTGFRQLADNITASVTKGDRVIVTGTLRIRDWETEDKAGTNIDIDADAIGHDLTFGTTVYTRGHQSSAPETDEGNAETETTSPAPASRKA